MPDETADETIETTEGNAGEAQEQSLFTPLDEVEIPDEVFDERQRLIGERRKEAGPPLDVDLPTLLPEEAETPEVPPSEPDESQAGEGKE